MLVRGIGIRDVNAVLKIGVTKVLKTLKLGKYKIKPRFSQYDSLETDEFWTYVKEKKNKIWLVCEYHRGSGEIAADNWDSFLSAFADDAYEAGKEYTAGIEGNNCRMRHRISGVSDACCFFKKLFNHWKAFDMAFFYINYGFV
jgi:IS1 family transposase